VDLLRGGLVVFEGAYYLLAHLTKHDASDQYRAGVLPSWCACLAQSPAEEQDDTLEAHYSGRKRLRLHACMGALVFVGYIDEYGEQREACYACSRCTARLR
jgi:hypothetical protein